MSERRQYFRRRTLLNGRLEVDKLNGWVIDCPVRNVSEGGARLTLPEHVVVPQSISLTISDGPKRPATLIWYSAGQAGFALDERRVTPRPVAANDTSANDTSANVTPARESRLAARVAAIAARGGQSPRFTQA